MSSLRDYFEREAGEYVARLRELIAETEPDPAELLRLARALRGSAQMAREGRVQEVAAALEAAGRALAVGSLAWDDAVAAAAAHTLDDIDALLRADQPPDALEERVAAAIARWVDRGVAAAGATTTIAGTLHQDAHGDADLYRFAARELDGARSELDAALPALEAEPRARERLLPVAERLRAVLGAAGLDRLGPIAPVLRALDDVARSAHRTAPGGETRLVQLFRASRDALDAAVESLAAGTPTTELPVFRRVMELHDDLGAPLASEPARVPAEAEGEDFPVEVLNFFRSESEAVLERIERIADELSSGVAERLPSLREEVRAALAALRDTARTFGFDGASRAAEEALGSGPDLPPTQLRELVGRLRSVLHAHAGPAEPDSEAESAPEAEARVSAEPEPARQPEPEPEPEPEPSEPLPIDELVYRGDAALKRALELREALLDRVRDDADTRRLAEELFDLIELGRP